MSSAKSWLCHPGVDRRAADPAARTRRRTCERVSPLEASTRYLEHLREAWDARATRTRRSREQDVIVTVPASFDAAARELTVEAARAAGLANVTLLEEPQAALYAGSQAAAARWRKQVKVGDVILVSTSAAAPPTSR